MSYVYCCSITLILPDMELKHNQKVYYNYYYSLGELWWQNSNVSDSQRSIKDPICTLRGSMVYGSCVFSSNSYEWMNESLICIAPQLHLYELPLIYRHTMTGQRRWNRMRNVTYNIIVLCLHTEKRRNDVNETMIILWFVIMLQYV